MTVHAGQLSLRNANSVCAQALKVKPKCTCLQNSFNGKKTIKFTHRFQQVLGSYNVNRTFPLGCPTNKFDHKSMDATLKQDGWSNLDLTSLDQELACFVSRFEINRLLSRINRDRGVFQKWTNVYDFKNKHTLLVDL